MLRFSARAIGEVALTAERRRHILERHPEVKPHVRRIARVLADPQTVRRSRYDPNVIIFYRRVKRNQYLAVVVKIGAHKFILTAYLTDRIAHATTIV